MPSKYFYQLRVNSCLLRVLKLWPKRVLSLLLIGWLKTTNRQKSLPFLVYRLLLGSCPWRFSTHSYTLVFNTTWLSTLLFQSWPFLTSISDFLLFLHFYLCIEQIACIFICFKTQNIKKGIQWRSTWPSPPCLPCLHPPGSISHFWQSLEQIYSIQNESIIFSTILDTTPLSLFVFSCKTG